MTIAAVQTAPTFGDPRGNLDAVLSTLRSVDADLYVLPELALTGYLFESREEALSFAELPDSEAFDPIAAFAREADAVVVFGFPERADSTVFNSTLLIASDGTRAVYRKIHLFWGEKDIFSPGDRAPEVVEVGGVRLGMMICFDWIFPEVARSLALQGADILCHPSNLVLRYCQDAMVTRAIENRVFTVTANRVGTEERRGESLTFTGFSEIVAPDGTVLAKAGGDREEVLVVDVDPAAAREKRVTPTNDVLADRRPSLYRL